MQYEVTIEGTAEGTLLAALDDLDRWIAPDTRLHITVTDQSSLVAVLNRLHGLGVSICDVQGVADGPPAADEHLPTEIPSA